MEAVKSGLWFLTGGGTMAARIAAHDWSATALGRIEDWPASLHMALSMVLNSRLPCCLCWGPGLLSLYNDAYRPLLCDADALGRPFREACAGNWHTVGTAARRALAGEAGHVEDMPVAPGRSWYSFSCNPVRDETGEVRGILCTASDATAKMQAIAALREKEQARLAEAALRQAHKMEAVGQLTGGLAHDFNNMLAGVAGHLELMKLRLKMGQTSGLVERIETALGATRRAASLTHRLLAFSRRQALDPKPTDVNALLLSMTDLVAHTAGPAIRVETDFAPAVWPVFCDPSQLESAVLNLATNARDAMPDGGTLRIGTANATLDVAAAALLPGLLPGEHVVITVSDNGAGMTPDVATRAFDPFFTTKPVDQGSGLGLAQAYGFATQSNGTLRLESTVGIGTTATLYLPRASVEAAPAADLPPVEKAAGAPVLNATVLFVEDDALVRDSVAPILEQAGATVLCAENGEAALRILEAGHAVDVLFSDIVMPGELNGVMLAKHVQQHYPRIAIVLATGYFDKKVELPGVPLLTKPYQTHAVITTLSQVIYQFV